MKKGLFLKLAGLGILVMITSVWGQPANRTTIDEKVAALVSRMTLEEKVGQMTQISLEVVSRGFPVVASPLQLDDARLRNAIVVHHIGSILNVGTRAHTVQKWRQIITKIQDVATQDTRLGIPIIYGIDAIHGANYTTGATLFPQAIGMAATWNPELVKRDGQITAYEVRASGIPWNFNPVLGVGRQPLWPRLFETFGEDPYLVSVMGAAYIKGLEGEQNTISDSDKVASCMKHYLGYSFPLSGKDRTPAWIPERMLREYFLPPFRAAVRAGSHTLMVNSSEINGIPVHSSHFLLTDVLRGELGFKGFVVSDWQDIENLYRREKVASTQKEAVKMAVMAGVDMSMVPLDFSFYNDLLELVRNGEVPKSRVDEAVTRILKVKYELGLFEHPYPDPTFGERFACKEFQQTNLQAAQESITLLKNIDGVLPLKKGARVLITGPTADKMHVLNSGWTITWQGNEESLYPKDKWTILQAIRHKIGTDRVTFVPGVSFEKEMDIPAAVEAARRADVAIVCLGEDAYCESEGNIMDLTLSEPQLKLAEAIEKTGTPVVLVLTEGRPRIINRITDGAKGILMAYLPGMEGGRAIADILFGDVNPSGKLPVTYPRYTNDFTLYDHKHSENNDEEHQYHPQFPFGFGLSYTKFSYTNLTVEPKTVKIGDPVRVSVTVRNAGRRAGKEVVQLYLSDLVASVTPSEKRLKRFKKIALAPGESKRVSFTLNKSDFVFFGRDNMPTVEPGVFKVSVSGRSKEFTLKK
ncbi:periplasmic beta-glucosidase precursor [bacterium BMS3Bbin03]|nr:periplasmic beta-glucosidase precursor [bacterium BMS3Bbin03]